jgi:hypothetical protein
MTRKVSKEEKKISLQKISTGGPKIWQPRKKQLRKKQLRKKRPRKKPVKKVANKA